MLSHRWYWWRSSSFWSAPGIMVAIQLVVCRHGERQCEMLTQEAGDNFQIGPVFWSCKFVCDGICLHVFGTVQHIFLYNFVNQSFRRSRTCSKHQTLYLRHHPAYCWAGRFYLPCFLGVKVEDPVNPTNNVGSRARTPLVVLQGSDWGI